MQCVHETVGRSAAKTALLDIQPVTQFYYFRGDGDAQQIRVTRAHACTYAARTAIHSFAAFVYDVYKNNLIRISLPLIHNVILAENVGQNNPDLKGRAAGIQIMPFVEGLINCNLSAVVYIHFILVKRARFDIRYSQSSVLIGFSLNTCSYNIIFVFNENIILYI